MRITVLAIVATIVFAGCVTNPYKTEDYSYENEPISAGVGLFLGFVPGLPQLINEEYAEAALYSAPTISGILLAVLMPWDTSSKTIVPKYPILAYVGLAGLYVSIGLSATDGYLTSKARHEVWEAETDRRSAERRKQREEAARNTILNDPRFSEQEKKAILAHEIFIGMSRDALIASWGEPNDINTSVGSWGKHEQMVYPGKSRHKHTYVYVENGTLTSWQQ